MAGVRWECTSDDWVSRSCCWVFAGTACRAWLKACSRGVESAACISMLARKCAGFCGSPCTANTRHPARVSSVALFTRTWSTRQSPCSAAKANTLPVNCCECISGVRPSVLSRRPTADSLDSHSEWSGCEVCRGSALDLCRSSCALEKAGCGNEGWVGASPYCGSLLSRTACSNTRTMRSICAGSAVSAQRKTAWVKLSKFLSSAGLSMAFFMASAPSMKLFRALSAGTPRVIGPSTTAPSLQVESTPDARCFA